MTRRCLITSEVVPSALQAELKYVTEYFSSRAQNSCKVLFGFAWGNEYYTGDWLEEDVALGSLVEKVRAVESSGLGRLGRDDLYVAVAGLEFQFCHESDLHLRYVESNDTVEHFFKRWEALGYQPAEWSCDETGAPEKKVRAYVA